MKFQETQDQKFFLTIAPFPMLDASIGTAGNTAFNVERNRYYRATLSQLFAFVGIANMFTSYEELANQTLKMFRRCGMCQEFEPYTYAVVGSPEVAVVAICEQCYGDSAHAKWVLFPPMGQ